MRTTIRTLAVAFICASFALAAPAAQAAPRQCSKTYTIAMFARAADVVYRGRHVPTRSDLAALHRFMACGRHSWVAPFDRGLWARRKAANWLRRHPPAPPAPALAYGQWAIPAYIVMCESGGANLPPNSAGASGYYQIIPSTWAAYGGSGRGAYLASKAEQDAVASRIWAGGSGAHQWNCA